MPMPKTYQTHRKDCQSCHFSKKKKNAAFFSTNLLPKFFRIDDDLHGLMISIYSMANANLNNSEWLVTNTTAASKYIPKRPRVYIFWNSPFQTKIYLVKVLLNVNAVKKDLLHRKQFLKILWRYVSKGESIGADSWPLRYLCTLMLW